MKTAILGYDTKNLGDDMQGLAAMALLNRVDAILNRDIIHQEPGFPVTCIFNSWFKLGDILRPPAPGVSPIFWGLCVGRKKLLESKWLQYLGEHAPIGCRDRHSRQLLEERGVNAHFTGCLTLRLGRQLPPTPDAAREGVLVVDISEEYLAARFDRELWRDAEFHRMDIGAVRRRPFTRLKLVSDLLRKIGHARLVITRRLHVGSPASSLGTPVILLPERHISRANERFTGFEELLDFRYQDELPAEPVADPMALINRGVRAHRDAEAAYDALKSRLAAAGLLTGGPLSWDYPAQLMFRFDTTGWPADATPYARCGWAEQAMTVNRFSSGIAELSIPGFLGWERFALEFFIETHDGGERAITPLSNPT